MAAAAAVPVRPLLLATRSSLRVPSRGPLCPLYPNGGPFEGPPCIWGFPGGPQPLRHMHIKSFAARLRGLPCYGNRGFQQITAGSGVLNKIWFGGPTSGMAIHPSCRMSTTYTAKAKNASDLHPTEALRTHHDPYEHARRQVRSTDSSGHPSGADSRGAAAAARVCFGLHMAWRAFDLFGVYL